MSKHIFWISSYPKSGNTLIRAIIASLFFSKDGVFEFQMLKHTTQFERRRRLNIIEKLNKNDFLNLDDLKVLSRYWQPLQSKKNLNIKEGFGFVKTHSALVSIYNNWFTSENLTAGYLYVVRDPRDVCISWSKHSGLNIDDSINFMLNFRSCIEWAKTDSDLPKQILPKTYLGSWSDHVLSWTQNNFNVPKLIIRYEDLVYNKENTIRKIINFFNRNFNIKFSNTEQRISNILQTTEFKKLKIMEEKKGFQEASSKNFFRKGEKNQWQNELNKSQILKIENKFRDFMNKFGYD